MLSRDKLVRYQQDVAALTGQGYLPLPPLVAKQAADDLHDCLFAVTPIPALSPITDFNGTDKYYGLPWVVAAYLCVFDTHGFYFVEGATSNAVHVGHTDVYKEAFELVARLKRDQKEQQLLVAETLLHSRLITQAGTSIVAFNRAVGIWLGTTAKEHSGP